MAIHGGTLITKDDASIKETLVTYQAEGDVPEDAAYSLVRTDKGLAVLEQGKDGKGVLFENHWEDADGDHFVAWVHLPGGGESRHGYEYVVPKDRMKSALRYVYPWGTYVVQKIDGVERPVPSDSVSPVSTLISPKSDMIRGLELREAARKGDIAKVETLLNADPTLINSKDGSGNTPLKYAAVTGSKKIAEILIAKGAGVNTRDGRGNAPLFHAAGNGNREVAEMLIARGADVNAKSKSGFTAFLIAVLNGHREMTEMLIAKGADINAKAIPEVAALHFAALKGHKEIADILIAKGVDVNAKDGSGLTPLYYASKYGHKGIAELLRKNGGIK
jgi:hypothetical protein